MKKYMTILPPASCVNHDNSVRKKKILIEVKLPTENLMLVVTSYEIYEIGLY